MHLPIVSQGDFMSADRPPKAGGGAPVLAAAGRGAPRGGTHARTLQCLANSKCQDRRCSFEIDLLSLAEQRPGIFGASGAPHVYSLACHRGADRKVPGRRAVRSLTVQIIRKFPRNKANKHHRIS